MPILMRHSSGDWLCFVLLLSQLLLLPIQERSATSNLRIEGLQQSLWIKTITSSVSLLCFNLMVWGRGAFVLSMGIILAILGPDQKVAVV